MVNGKKNKVPNHEEKKQVGLFELVEEKEEHTLDKILSKRILAPVVRLSDSDAESKRCSELINMFRDRYLVSVKAYTDRGVVLNVVMFNRCCDDLFNSLSISELDRTVIDILKNIINEVATDNLRLVYVYSCPQSEMIRFISEYHNHIENFDSRKTIDRAYREVFDEIREWRKNKSGIVCI